MYMIRWVHDNSMHTSAPRTVTSHRGTQGALTPAKEPDINKTHTQVRGLLVEENRESRESEHLVSQAKSHPPDLEEHLCSDLGF